MRFCELVVMALHDWIPTIGGDVLCQVCGCAYERRRVMSTDCPGPKLEAEVVELFGVKFSGHRHPETGRIYVPLTPESKIALAELGRVGREMTEREGK